ncbi:MAG: hypothetical protein KFW09_04960 [Oscillospiraceae bacterium]|nr:hypothetical protein [Oscillospiraceae bacterium]
MNGKVVKILNDYGLVVDTQEGLMGFISDVVNDSNDGEDNFIVYDKTLEVDFPEGMVGECYPEHLEDGDYDPVEESLLKVSHLFYNICRIMLEDCE